MLRYKNLRSNVKGVCKNTWLRGTKIQDDSICDYEKVILNIFEKLICSSMVVPMLQCQRSRPEPELLTAKLICRGSPRSPPAFRSHPFAPGGYARPHGCHRAIAIQHHPAITIYSFLEFYWVPPPPWHGRELGRWDLITSHSNDSKLWSIYSILIQGRSCHHFDDLPCMITICKVQLTVYSYSG